MPRWRLPDPEFIRARLGEQSRIVHAIWGTLIVAMLAALVIGRWSIAFVALATLALSVVPVFSVERFHIRLPVSFFVWIDVFVFATIFLGEALDFYERYWWWDIALHGGAAVGFGLIGFLFIFTMFEGNRYAAPPAAVSFFAFCFAVAIGSSWEIFEFGMDQIFGLNMQKSGLVDTMSDLIVDAVGATLGALAGFFYLKGLEFGGLSGMIGEFIRLNRQFFRKDDANRDE